MCFYENSAFLNNSPFEKKDFRSFSKHDTMEYYDFSLKDDQAKDTKTEKRKTG